MPATFRAADSRLRAEISTLWRRTDGDPARAHLPVARESARRPMSDRDRAPISNVPGTA